MAKRACRTERSEIDRSRRRRAPKECDRRSASKLPQPPARRMPQSGDLSERDRGPRRDRGMATLLQPGPPSQRIGLPKPGRLCQNHDATRISPRNLTFKLAQKGCPDHTLMNTKRVYLQRYTGSHRCPLENSCRQQGCRMKRCRPPDIDRPDCRASPEDCGKAG